MIKTILKVAAIPFMVLSFAGCAASPAIQPKPVVSSKAASMESILVGTASATTGEGVEAGELKDAIISSLRETALFKNVNDIKAATNASPGVKVEAKITEIKRVSAEDRNWAGVLAGKARIVVRVTVSDLTSENRIEVFEAEGRSGQTAYGGTTEEAIQRAADEIKRELVKLYAEVDQ